MQLTSILQLCCILILIDPIIFTCMRVSIFKLLQAAMLIVSVTAHATDFIQLPGLKLASLSDLNYRVLRIESLADFLWTNLYVGFFYYALYLGVGTALESTNPAPKTEYRKLMTKKEIALGLTALFWVILSTTFWMWKIEHHGPYYGYYAVNPFGLWEFFTSLAVYFLNQINRYMILFDIWFFSTHVALHHPFFWHYIHSYHHQFLEPSAFGQDAVHPIESVIQGPCGHFILSLIFPMHPVAHSVFGFFTGLYAIFAHDGRWDPADHNKHHFYTSCNYGLYGFMDYTFKTKYTRAQYPVDYVPTWIQQADPKKYNG